MKNILLILLLSLSSGSFGQATEMLWGPEFKVKGEIEFVGEHNGSVYTYRIAKKLTFFERYEMEGMTSEISVPLEMEIKSGDRLSIEYTYILPNGDMVILASRYDKNAEENTIYGKVINKEGDVVTDWKELTDIKASSKRNTGNFTIVRSPDSKLLLIVAVLPENKKEQQKYKLALFSNAMEKSWDRKFTLPYKDKTSDLFDFQVTNTGITYILANVGPESRKERKKKQKEKEDINTKVLVTYNGETEEMVEHEIKLDNKTVLDMTIHLDTMQNLVITGFYRNNLEKRGGLSGVFYSRLKFGEKEPEPFNTRDFEKAFIEQIIGERRAKKGAEIPTSYNLDYVIPTADGGVILLAEQFFITESCTRDPKTGRETCTITYHFNSIIAVGVSPSGEILWNALIPKEQAESRSSTGVGVGFVSYRHTNLQGIGKYLSYSVMVTDKEVHLIFLDNKKNLNEFGEKVPLDETRHVNVRKSVAIVASLSLSGEVSYSVLYDSKKEKIYLQPRSSEQINGSAMAMLGTTKKKKTRLARINF